jgi:hypothetical protein
MFISRTSRGGDRREIAHAGRGAKDCGEYREVAGAAEKQVTRTRQPPDFMICATWAAAASNSELKEREVSFSLSFAPEQVKIQIYG